MKALVIAVTLLFASASFAGEFTSFGSNGEFTSFAGEFTSFSKVHFQSGSTWVSSNKVCHDNGLLFHMTKSTIRVEQCDGDGGGNCKSVEKPLHPQPVASTRLVCARRSGSEDTCLKWERVPFIQEPVAKLNVYRSARDWENSAQPIKTHRIPMPNCF